MKIEIRGLGKSYGSVRALLDVTMDIDPGQIVVLLGPNGAGKTTLLGCLSGVLAPRWGSIQFDGMPFRRDNLELRWRMMFLPDFPVMYGHITVVRHIGMVLRLFGKDQPGVEERVIDLLRDFDLLPYTDAPLAGLSRGQLYKTALVAMLAADPELWLLDEPFASGMDPHGIASLKKHARSAAGRGRTVVYSTQLLDVAERFADRACIIHRGKLPAFDRLETLRGMAVDKHGVLEEIFESLREDVR